MTPPSSYLSRTTTQEFPKTTPWQWALRNSEIQVLLHMGRPEIMYEIFKNTKMTYSHLVKTINSLEAKKLLLTVKKGRRRIVHITRKGIRVQLLLDRIGDALK